MFLDSPRWLLLWNRNVSLAPRASRLVP